MDKLIKNIEHKTVLKIKDEVTYQKGQIVSKTLDGVGKITIEGEEFILNESETIVMPAKKPHAVFAKEQFKMLLIVMFPEE